MPEEHHRKPAKTAAKKAPAKKAPHPPEKDARRAFEHLGRVRVLLSMSKPDQKRFDTLLTLATQTFQAKKYKHSADLLRAAEHFAFAGLLVEDNEVVSSELRKEIEHELKHLQEKAADHADPEEMEEPVRGLFLAATSSARECFGKGAYRAALDYARAAEALTHIDDLGMKNLLDHSSKRLAS